MPRLLNYWSLAAFAATAGFGIALGSTPSPDPKDTQAEIRELKTRLDQLERNLAANPSPAAPNPAAENDANTTAATVQTDADNHPRLFDIGTLSAGWDGKQFILRSEDGAFSLHPGLVFDFRNITNYRQAIPAKGGGETNSTGDDTQNGFDVTRMRFVLDGTLFRNLGYFVQVSADQGNPLTLLDAYATYRFDGSPFSIKAGQFKDPLWHERNLSEARLMAVDRSLVENYLAGGQGSRVQGVGLIYDQNRLRGQLVFHDGFNTQNTKFFDAGGVGAGVGSAAGVTPTNFGGSTRVDYLLIGNRTPTLHPFADYDGGFSSLGSKQATLIAGGGVDFTQGGSNDLILHTADIQFNHPSGFSAYAAYLGSYRSLNSNQGVKAGDYYDPGFLFQLAYVINQKFEPFARYDYAHLDPGSVSGLGSRVVQEITVGVNYYLYQQNAKFTIDATYLPNGAPADADALGVLKDSDHNEFLLRAQFQIAI